MTEFMTEQLHSSHAMRIYWILFISGQYRNSSRHAFARRA
jgi:hypothetical protein